MNIWLLATSRWPSMIYRGVAASQRLVLLAFKLHDSDAVNEKKKEFNFRSYFYLQSKCCIWCYIKKDYICARLSPDACGSSASDNLKNSSLYIYLSHTSFAWNIKTGNWAGMYMLQIHLHNSVNLSYTSCFTVNGIHGIKNGWTWTSLCFDIRSVLFRFTYSSKHSCTF